MLINLIVHESARFVIVITHFFKILKFQTSVLDGCHALLLLLLEKEILIKFLPGVKTKLERLCKKC